MKGKSLGRSLCLLVLCKGLVLAPSQFQLLKCKEPNATRNSPQFLSSSRMRAATTGKGGQKGVYTMRRARGSPGTSLMLLLWASGWG